MTVAVKGGFKNRRKADDMHKSADQIAREISEMSHHERALAERNRHGSDLQNSVNEIMRGK